MMKKLVSMLLLSASISVLTEAAPPVTKEELTANFIYGTPDMKSMTKMAFGPEGILFIGDNESMIVWAVDLNEKKKDYKSAALLNVEHFEMKASELYGIKPASVRYRDMDMSPVSGNVYFIVKDSDSNQDFLVKMDEKGNLSNVSLEGIRYSNKTIDDAPHIDTMMPWNVKSRTYTISDIEFSKTEVLVSGLSNEEFASSLRRISFPFKEEGYSTTGLQVFHVSHNANETHAPIHHFEPVQVAEIDYIFAGYACTPLVAFNTNDLKDQVKLTGKTVAELGAGNSPNAMLSYTSNGTQYLLVGNNEHPLMRFRTSTLVSANGLTLENPGMGVAREQYNEGSIAHLANYSTDQFLILNYDGKQKSYVLRSRSKDFAENERINRFADLIAEGKMREAKRIWEEAATHKKKRALFTPGIMTSLGYIFLNSNRYEDAIATFKYAADAYPEDANVWDSLGESYKAVGEKNKAIACFRKCLSLNPSDYVKANSIKLLKELGVEVNTGSNNKP